MLKEDLWKVFEKTGDPGAYLRYRAEMSKEIAPPDIKVSFSDIKKMKDDDHEKYKGTCT